MTREEIIEAIQNDNMMPFLQDWEARDVVDFVLKNIRPELPEWLEEAAEKASKTWRRNEDGSESKELFPKTFIRGFKAGAEWQREQDQQLIELAEDHAMLAGMNKMKEEMMEKAVEGVAEELYNDGDVHCTVGVGTHFKPGDKVRVIVIPE